jgi:hypothetical protein
MAHLPSGNSPCASRFHWPRFTRPFWIFLRNRDDAVLFGAQAVNAYVEEARMTQNVDILSTRASPLAEELRDHLARKFNIATRVRVSSSSAGFRIYQLRQPKNRHLADVRQIGSFGPTQMISDIRVPVPEELIAQKVMSLCLRSAQPKGDTDRRDLKLLLLAYPQFKEQTGPALDRLRAAGAAPPVIAEWSRLAASEIQAPTETDEF